MKGLGPMLKDSSTPTDPRLGRIPRFDERSRQFSIRTLVEDRPERSYTWSVGATLDQGQEGACVGFGYTHELIARPRVVPDLTNDFARNLYWDVQRIDPWPGGAYPGAEEFYEGTSVLDGARWVKSLGYYDEYRWAFGEKDLALAVGYKGPAVIGINWYEGMFSPDGSGLLHVSGNVAGGHCLLVRSISVRRGVYMLHNSWGPSWGVGGDAYVTREDMARLLHEDGDACVPVVRTKKLA